MGRSFLESLKRMRQAESVLDLRERVVEFAQELGFQSVFFLAPIAKDPREGRVLTNVGFSRIWERAYRRSLYLVDPMPEAALRHSMAFRWRDLLDEPDLLPGGERYLKLIARHGMADGIVVPTFGPGNRCGLLGAGHFRGAAPADDDVIRLQVGVQMSFLRYCDLVTSDNEGPALSNREMDVLFWITRGKSNSVIADILGISTPTVDTYLRRIFLKLRVADRTAAALTAVERGLFVAGSYRAEPEAAV